MRALFAIAMLIGAGLLAGQGLAEPPPWKHNKPIVAIDKALFRKRPARGGAAHYWVGYIGPKLERMEVVGIERRDDIGEDIRQRFSNDNGRSWSHYEPLPPILSYPKGVEIGDFPGVWEYDPRSGAILQMCLRQISFEGKQISYRGAHNYSYYRFTLDRGKTWSPFRQLRYEPGKEFDPKDPIKPGFLQHNQGYTGSNLLFHSKGTVIFGLTHANAANDPDNAKRGWKMGSLLMIARWDASAKNYRWEAGQRVEIKPTVSSRGLMEASLAELNDGRVLAVWRGSSTPQTPGRKFFSISHDGGHTLTPVAEWKYDDGTSFYSPSSSHLFLRHSVTKKLYWFGNISELPPKGNNPRYPLIIAEVDEQMPALKKKTVTVIDDRRPGQSEKVSYSNFCVLEDRKTHRLEMYLSVYGEDAKFPLNADGYRYLLTLIE